MGNIDLPTMIDYVIDKTGIEKVLYIGHSQGVSCFFVMVSERPEYNDKVQLMVGLGPVVYANHTRTPIIKIIVPIQHPLEVEFKIKKYVILNDKYLVILVDC